MCLDVNISYKTMECGYMSQGCTTVNLRHNGRL
jgi:hypothetical protein